MEDQQPSLQVSNTDGTGPVKRRRPALSCVECRRRKVKCDREKPCGPCTRSKSPTCTYRPHPQSDSRQASSPTSGSASHDGSARAFSRATAKANDFDSMLNRYIAPGIFGPHGKDTLAPISNSHSDPSDSNAPSTIRALVDKVRDLEGRLAAISEGGSSGSINSSIRNTAFTPAGQFVKSKFYGESHWVNCIEPYEALVEHVDVNPSTHKAEINKSSELYAAISECKRMARTLKSTRMLHPSLSSEVQSSIPSKDVCDELVQCYLRTFESVFRVLHIPTFLKEYECYWKNTASAKPSVLTKILLVCAIGVPFYNGEGQARLRASCPKWVQAAASWLSAPHEKSRLNMAGLQIHILLINARQVCGVDGDLIWIPAGALLRSAMHLGLHRDASHFPKMSVFHTEMRRRLWATVMEITVQSCLDMGMPPMISLQDFDTLSPSNINDEDIDEGKSTSFEAKPLNEFTQTSIQIAFNQTLPLRLEITRVINNLRSDISYDDVLRLGSELTTTCRTNSHRLQASLSLTPGTNPFQIKLIDVLVRRFILCLHRPFFAKATTNPKYYYSRKICLDTSLAILSPASHLGMTRGDDWTRLMAYGVGFVKSFFLYSISTVYLELNNQIGEQQQDAIYIAPPRTSATVASDSTLLSAESPPSQPAMIPPPQFHMLRNVLVQAKQITEERVRNGETNAKGVIFLACALARVDAIVSHSDPDCAVLDAARKEITTCAETMREAYKAEHDVDIDANVQTDFAAGSENYRGEGADVVLEDGGEADGGDIGGGNIAWECMDWESLMQDESMDFGFGFEESPESWFLRG